MLQILHYYLFIENGIILLIILGFIGLLRRYNRIGKATFIYLAVGSPILFIAHLYAVYLLVFAMFLWIGFIISFKRPQIKNESKLFYFMGRRLFFIPLIFLTALIVVAIFQGTAIPSVTREHFIKSDRVVIQVTTEARIWREQLTVVRTITYFPGQFSPEIELNSTRN